MPSRADVEEYAQANQDIRTLVLADLAAFWATLDTLDALATRNALLEVVPLLVAQYGETAASIAADFYDRLREQASPKGRVTAVLGDPVDVEELRGQIRWSIDPLFSANPDPKAALGRLQIKVDEFTLQPGRDTIATSAAKDPAKAHWARVPVGKTCAFCLTLASRGPVYRSAESAGQARKFHGDCDCTPTPYWYGDPHPEGYDPDALYQQYADARDEVGSYRLKPILAEIRSQQGLAH
jgi:hypothetical protein